MASSAREEEYNFFEEVWKGQRCEILCFSMGVLNKISKEGYNLWGGLGIEPLISKEKIM